MPTPNLQPPLSISAQSMSDGISISWQPNPANPAGVSFAIYRCPAGNASQIAIIAEQISSSSFTDASAMPGVAYDYFLHAQIADGTTSGSAAPVSATFVAPPALASDAWLATFSQDSDGYAIFPAANPVIVGSQPGDCSTFSAAQALCFKQNSRCILFRRGETFDSTRIDDDLQLTGISPSQPFVIGATSDVQNPRPILTRGFGIGGTAFGRQSVNFVVISGLDFYADQRDPASPTYNPSSQSATWYQCFALRMIAGGSSSPLGGNHLWIEDCRARFFEMPFDLEGNFSTLVVRRNIIDHAWSYHYGLYISGISDVLIAENYFDHNGWNETAAPKNPGTLFNQNIYLQYSSAAPYRSLNNISSRAGCYGQHFRPGGTIDGDVYIANPHALDVWDHPSIVRNCIFTGSGFNLSDGTTNPAGDGLIISGTPTISVANCIFTDKLDSTNNYSAISIGNVNSSGATSPVTATFTNVIVHNWSGPSFHPNNPGGKFQFTHCDLPSFTAPGVIPTPKYVAPARTIAKYAASQNIPNGAEGFLDAIVLQRRGNFKSTLSAQAVAAWFRAGFTFSS